MGMVVPSSDPPPPKRRKLKNLDVEKLSKLLMGLHHCLKRLVERTVDGEKPEEPVQVPLLALEEEFERYWQLRFDPRAVGEVSTAGFLRRFTDVFTVRNDGIQLTASPAEDPNFEQSAEVGIEMASRIEHASEADFATSLGEWVAASLANLVAEERKASGAPLSYQYANYEVVSDLLSRTRDGTSKEEQAGLLDTLLDPKPPAPTQAPEKMNKEVEHDREEFRDRGDQGGFQNDGNRGKGGGMRSDRPPPPGRQFCRYYQRDGRCTYGDNCRFVHD